jgi:ketosteroid isomerase-like protein
VPYAPQFIADYIEICQLSARYNQLSDAADGVEYAKLFVEDGLWESGPPHARMRAQGPEQLAATCAAMGKGIVHITCNPYIEVQGDRATHTCKMIIFTGSPDKTSNEFVGTGRYTDELVRTPDGWRFTHRSSVMDKELGPVVPTPADLA